MKKNFFLIVLSFILLISLTGCENSSIGIDDYYFVIGLGLDEAENDYIKLSIQIPSNPKNSSSDASSSQSSSYEIYSVEARTIEEAINILDNYLNKQINLSHCSAIVISESLAKKGIDQYINSLNNNVELRYNCQTIISSSTAYDLLEKVSNSGEAFSARLFDYLKNTTNYTGYTIESSIGTFAHDIDSKFCEATAIYTKVNNDIIQTAGIAVFKDQYLVGNLDVLESIAHLMVTNKLNKCFLTMDSIFIENGKIDFDTKLYKKTNTYINMINGSPFIKINVFPEISILNSGTDFDYNSSYNVEKVTHAVNKYYERIIKNYLYKISKDYNSDIDCFQGLYQSTFLTKEDFSKINWDKNFQNSFFEVNVTSRIYSSNLFNKE